MSEPLAWPEEILASMARRSSATVGPESPSGARRALRNSLLGSTACSASVWDACRDSQAPCPFILTAAARASWAATATLRAESSLVTG